MNFDIEMNQVTVRYGNVEALKNISLKRPYGKLYGLLGRNGAGKTTFIGKLAAQLKREGKSVLLAAADTFRAGAITQLRLWAERVGVEFVGGQQGGDAAAIAFDAIDAALSRGLDVVIVDTAGRLHTSGNLMDELKKVVRVIQKRLPDAPHEVLLVLDGTIGQNAVAQAKTFAAAVPVSESAPAVPA